MGLTRNYDSITDRDGPTSGALQVISIGFDDVANSETVSRQINLPPGCAFYITDIVSMCDAVTSDPKITVGTSAAGAEIVASISLTAAVIEHTLVANQVAANGLIDVVLVADAGDVVESASVTIIGYMTRPPSSVPDRGADSPG